MKNTEKGKSKSPSQRQLRVAEEIRHVIGKMFTHDDLFIEGLKPAFLMVTQVSISPDLSYATAFVQTVGSEDIDEQISLLNHNKGMFRYQVGKNIRLRIVPDIIFKSDASFENSKYIDNLLNSPRVRADIEKQPDEEIE